MMMMMDFKLTPHHIEELDTFESDLMGLVWSIRYIRVNNNIQPQIRNELNDIEGNC